MLLALGKSKASEIFCILDFLSTIKLKKKREKEGEGEGAGRDGVKWGREKGRMKGGKKEGRSEIVIVLLRALFLLYIWDLLG